ncbi:MAG: CYTH domain-containing protein [Clostridiales Family XIII bacterium]|jgi:inorganic triphosphatase YgiF|nr:CYTH domain-containing protein [Clostridiales Family XIII bacterium]
MEIELKYSIDNTEQAGEILEDSWVLEHAESQEPEEIRMKAAYFDTEDRLLTRNNIAFRIRTEGAKTLATLKWKDDDEGISGLYVRSEVNVPVSDPACFFHPDPEIFIESEDGMNLLEVIEGKTLVNVFDMIFTRRRLRIDVGRSILEISFDEGVIVAGAKSEQVREMEIEIYSGSRDDLLETGNLLVEKYGLKPELRTKFARGVALLSEQ